ncbi:ribonuclease H-like protein [Exidia glandulosa HHB12029]|uniref:ribonuclease H n=1 Tax=Exidia glandulosa HHB12029 TaxID=1314781 RepID=A0A165JRV7_EXIGL|nr:ribonuclease H-like protein [Exidia glandulosa HHB12029]
MPGVVSSDIPDGFTTRTGNDGTSDNPLLRLGHQALPKGQRPMGPPGVQRPSSRSLIASMTRSDSPRRFVPPTEQTRPSDLFHERKDFSINRFPRYFHKDDDRTMLVYIDGACLDQGDLSTAHRRRGGCAFVYCDSKPGQKLALEGTVGGSEQTSNRAELRAVLFFLQLRMWEAGGADRIVIATDSEYVVEGACGRIDTWIARDWRTANGSPVANRDLWEALRNELRIADEAQLSILFWRIPREWNARCDALAKEAANDTDRDAELGVVSGLMM